MIAETRPALASEQRPIKKVKLGSAHTCVDCGCLIPDGSVAYRYRRRAETYHERLHADNRNMVAWYHCGCAIAREEGRAQ